MPYRHKATSWQLHVIAVRLFFNSGWRLCFTVPFVKRHTAVQKCTNIVRSSVYVILLWHPSQTCSCWNLSLLIRKSPVAEQLVSDKDSPSWLIWHAMLLCSMQHENEDRASTYGYMAIVVNLTKMSLLGASAALQVKAWGGGILCFLQKSVGERLYSCLTSCRSDFAATIKQGILLSIKCCYGIKNVIKIWWQVQNLAI
jgi:hypothetical protein